LREHLASGRLTLAEFTVRMDATLQSRVGAELARVQENLPEISMETHGSQRKPTRLTAAMFGHVARRGRLRLQRRVVACSGFGDLDLDLRNASMDPSGTAITVLAGFGNVDLYVPEGVNVEVVGVSLFGHCRDFGRDPDRQDAPKVRVRVVGFAGTVDVWRVPHAMHDRSYDDIMDELEGE
ncbi:MAG TPA: LiaF domain-containing protein, partial [Nocardioidaceae bacterium]|nr:LiaF domain-containing protein [Nocardioidaceae bacterium]